MIPVRQYIHEYITHPGNVAKHYDILLQAGFIPVRMNRYVGIELHDWAAQYIGKENYNWTGSVFWFNNEKDAMLFSLRWL